MKTDTLQIIRAIGSVSRHIADNSTTPQEASERLQKVLNFVVSAVEIAAEFTETAAPIAEMVGMAMGNPGVAVGAKMAGVVASQVDDAIDAKKAQP